MKSSGGKYLWTPSSKLALAPGLQSGVERLAEMPTLTVNGSDYTPNFMYLAQDYVAPALAGRYGSALLLGGSGSDPAVDQPSPLASAGEEGIEFSYTGKELIAGDNVVGAIGTYDAILEVVVANLPFGGASGYIISKSDGLFNVWGLYWTSTYWQIIVHDGTANVASVSSNPLQNGLQHILWAVNRDENSQYSSRFYINGDLSGTGANMSSVQLTWDKAIPLTINGRSPDSLKLSADLYYAALWTGPNMLAAGAAGQAEIATIAKERYAALIGSKPTRSYSILYPQSAGCTSAAHQTKLLSDGTSRIFKMGAGTPRFEIGVDGNGEKYCGAVVEGAVENLCLQSDDINTTWAETDAATAADGVVGPDGLVVAGHDTLTASADGGYIAQSFAAITAAAHVFSYQVKRKGASDVAGKLQLITTSTGATIAEQAFTAGANWSKVFVTGTASLNDTSIRAVIDSNADAIHLRCAQLETGKYPSEYVKTTTAAVTKPADVQYYPIVEGRDIGIGQGSAYIKFVAPDFTPTTNHFLCTLINSSSAGNIAYAYLASDKHLHYKTLKPGGNGGNVSGDAVTSYADNKIHEILLTWKRNDLKFYIDGSLASRDNVVDIPLGIDRLYLGTNAVPSFHAAPVRIIDARLFDRPIRPHRKKTSLRFILSASPSVAPTITAATLADSDFIWRGPGGTFTGKTPAIGNFVAGDYFVRCSNWSAVTKIDFNSANMASWNVGDLFSSLTALEDLRGYSNAALATDISGWTLPASLTNLYLNTTSVSGDISGWTLPAILATMSLSSTGISGDISGWTLPSSLANLILNTTSVSGDISGWTLPSSLSYLHLYNTSVSGDISGWTLPVSLAYLYLHYTSVSGDISGWTLPASLTNLYLSSTGVSGDISGWTLPASLTDLYLNNTGVDYGSSGALASATRNSSTYRLDNCAMTTTEVDQALADAVTSATTGSILNLGGTNQASTGGSSNADYVTLGTRGWTVTIS